MLRSGGLAAQHRAADVRSLTRAAAQRHTVQLACRRCRRAASIVARAGGSSPEPGRDAPASSPADGKAPKQASPAGSLDLAFESDSKKVAGAVKTTGLRRAPLSGGDKTATNKYDLPSPAVAVRNLVEQAQFAHLCTVMSTMHHRRGGYPFGTLVDFASDGAGYPIFCLSPLAIHARNLIEDPRCAPACSRLQPPGGARWACPSPLRQVQLGSCRLGAAAAGLE
jgi:hypothetical protein